MGWLTWDWGSNMAGKNYHQDAVPVEKYKFDAEADANARGEYLTPVGQEQDMRTKQKIQKARIDAQMQSHKNPKNRVY